MPQHDVGYTLGIRMQAIRIGDRVRVNARQLVHHRQMGTVIALSPTGGYYVHLDYDGDRQDAGVFFHSEELEPGPAVQVEPLRVAQGPRDAALEREPEPGTPAQPASVGQVAHISEMLHAQADDLSEEAARTTQHAGEVQAEATRLEDQAGDLRRRADQLHARAEHLRDQVEP